MRSSGRFYLPGGTKTAAWKTPLGLGTKLGESVVTRWRQTDESTEAIIALTRTLAWLTWVLVSVGLATLAVTIVTVVQG
jgi:hypothetical protein